MSPKNVTCQIINTDQNRFFSRAFDDWRCWKMTVWIMTCDISWYLKQDQTSIELIQVPTLCSSVITETRFSQIILQHKETDNSNCRQDTGLRKKDTHTQEHTRVFECYCQQLAPLASSNVAVVSHIKDLTALSAATQDAFQRERSVGVRGETCGTNHNKKKWLLMKFRCVCVSFEFTAIGVWTFLKSENILASPHLSCSLGWGSGIWLWWLGLA